MNRILAIITKRWHGSPHGGGEPGHYGHRYNDTWWWANRWSAGEVRSDYIPWASGPRGAP